MKDETQKSPFVILDLPPKGENFQVAGPYSRSPSLSPRTNAALEPVSLTINGKKVTVPAGAFGPVVAGAIAALKVTC